MELPGIRYEYRVSFNFFSRFEMALLAVLGQF